MSSLPPIHFHVSSTQGKTKAYSGILPQFAGQGQTGDSSAVTQAQQPSRPRINRPRPVAESCMERVAVYIGTGIGMVIKGTCYLIPDFIKKPIAQKLKTKLDAWIASVKHDPDSPKTKTIAHHELGHAITGLSADLPMEGLHMMNILGRGGGVIFQAGPQTPEEFYKHLLTLMGGHAAELNKATDEQLQDMNFIEQSRMRLLSDIVSAISLTRKANAQGWLHPGPDERIPDEINLKHYQTLIQKKGRNEAEQAQQKAYALRVREFLRLSVVQQALKTARQIHASVPAEKREQMADAVASCDLRLSQDELYDLLEKHLSPDEIQRMQTIQQKFIQQQTRVSGNKVKAI